MTDKSQENIDAGLAAVARIVTVRMLAAAAPQIFKRNGDVKTCPRKLVVKMGFKAKLDMYNMTKKAVNDNFKYDVEPKITFCTAEFSVTMRGDLAMFIVEETTDILAQVLDAGWSVC